MLLCQIACEEGRAVIIVSHDQRIRAAAKRVITIKDGRLTGEEAGEHNQHCRMHPHHDRHTAQGPDSPARGTWPGGPATAP
jgi:ABC-type glutathione transport system ATPase component